MRKQLFVFAIAALMCWFAQVIPPAMAQAGSVGGTIGNRDKSASGGEEQPAHGASQPKHRSKSSSRGPRKRPSRAATAAMPEGSAGKVYDNPTINGLRVNWCLAGLSGCGQDSASTLCRSKGLARAIEFKWEVAGAAYNQGDHTLCSGFCGVFTQVTCE